MKAHVIFPAALALAGTLLALAPAQAQTKTVTLSNMGLLNGQGTFSVQFNLANGISTADGNATAALSNFSLTGGSLGTATTIGDATGNLGSAVTLDDGNTGTAGFATFQQVFTITSSASTLSFNLSLAATSIDAGSPDDFYFQILDGAGNPLATNGPNFTELVNANYANTLPTPVGFTTQNTSNGVLGTNPNFAGITATITNTPVPEASTTVSLGLLLALGLGGLAVSARRRKVSASR